MTASAPILRLHSAVREPVERDELEDGMLRRFVVTLLCEPGPGPCPTYARQVGTFAWRAAEQRWELAADIGFRNESLVRWLGPFAAVAIIDAAGRMHVGPMVNPIGVLGSGDTLQLARGSLWWEPLGPQGVAG